MKQPPASHFRRNTAAIRNLRIVCSFNGAFRRRPPFNTLKYVGGDTRIVSVDRNIGFSKLRSRVADLSQELSSFTLRYRLSVRDTNDESDTSAPLVSVSSDGDVRRMIEDYEKMELSGKKIRLWIFVSRSDNGFESNADIAESNGANRSIVSSENNGQFGDFSRVKKDRKVRCSDDSLRKSVLKQNLSAKQLEDSDNLRDVSCRSDIEVRRNCEDYQQKSDQQREGQYQYQGSMLAYKTQAAGINGSCLHPLNPRDGNSNYLHNSDLKLIDVYGSKQESEKIGRQSQMRLNRENIMPWIVDFPYETQCSVIAFPVTSQIPGNNANNCNLRAHPYYVRNHKSKPAEMANSQTQTLNGMLSPVIFHPSFEPPSDISKQAKLDGTNSRIFTDIASGGRKSSGDSLFENSEHKNYGLACDNAKATIDYHSFLSCTTVENSSPVDDLLTGSPYEFYENPNQSSCSINKIPDLSSNPYYIYGQESADRIPTNGIHCWESGVASSVNLMDNLSLSATNKESPTPSSLTSNDVSFSLVNPETRESGLLDGELVTIPKVDKAVQWNSYSCNPATEQNVKVKQQHIQQNQKDKDDTKQDIKSSKATNDNSTDLVPLYTRHLQTIKHADLEYIKELGSGTYGTVFHGTWKGSDVAIKNIKPSCFNGGSQHDDRLVEDFWKEAKILGKLHHPNIVAFYGVVTDGLANSLATVTEYMVNGSLKQVLQLKDRSIDRRKRVRLAMDAAFGMEYLHDKKIVHFDLKSHNLLVNMRDPRRPVCKIGDLGLSKIKQRTLISGGVRGTIPWMAPELLNSDNKMVTEKVDVFSFGIVMWELLTGEEPYANLRSQELIGGIIKGSMRPEIPSWCDPGWRSLMERCWSSDPESRPSFSEIAKELRSMGAALNIQ